jgi:hypothetical protein
MKIAAIEGKHGMDMELHAENCGHLKFRDEWTKPYFVEYDSAEEAKKDQEDKNDYIEFKIAPCLKKKVS